jgi:hypothetical protein
MKSKKLKKLKRTGDYFSDEMVAILDFLNSKFLIEFKVDLWSKKWGNNPGKTYQMDFYLDGGYMFITDSNGEEFRGMAPTLRELNKRLEDVFTRGCRFRAYDYEINLPPFTTCNELKMKLMLQGRFQ